jgi:hypothetical protein
LLLPAFIRYDGREGLARKLKEEREREEMAMARRGASS